ncbi:hypothetical protein ICW40_03855 [Actinotalea ferrariae]|uniref:hypothetical protein n=1 Tax=Actinotalea ferrariae TaxID=1386098 RepID=UPI001C8CF0D4|nr:hypothetical protein [Actinotalea ferrariae]MBX9243940.1 hypothetical protein [Actinotalea ferrariae]
MPQVERRFVPADVVRVAGLVSLVVAVVWRGPVDAMLFALVAGGLLVPRLLRVPQPLDVAYGVLLIVAAWFGALDVYQAVWWTDLALHLVATGVVAAVAWFGLLRRGAVTDPRLPPGPRGVVVVTACVGLALSVLWEIAEYLGNKHLDPTIFVEYADTVEDMAIGGFGSALAGLGLSVWARRTAGPAPTAPGARPTAPTGASAPS